MRWDITLLRLLIGFLIFMYPLCFFIFIFCTGINDIETVMTFDSNTIEHWPAICQEMVTVFHIMHAWHRRQQQDFTGPHPPLELATYTDSFFTICKRMVLGLQVRFFFNI